MGKPKSKKPKVDYQAAWESYSTWKGEDAMNYQQNVAQEKARMGASGLKVGSAGYETRLSSMEEKFAKQSSALEGGATGTLLRKRYEKRTQGMEPDARPTMEQYYTDLYGPGGGAKSAADESVATAKQAAGGGLANLGTGGGGRSQPSPWLVQEDDTESWMGV